MKVMVIGCQGQVGQQLVNRLQPSEHTLIAVDRQQLDITNPHAVYQVVATYQPNVIVNAAAYTAVDRAESEPQKAHAVNRVGPQYLAEAARDHDALLLHISTDYVFQGSQSAPYKESDPTAPQSVYGKTKLAGEQAIQETWDKHVILRTAWVFSEKGHNFVNTMLKFAHQRDHLSIVGDQLGGPTYAGDIADALIAIAQQLIQNPDPSHYGLYHFSGEPHVSWFEFAQTIFQQAASQQLYPHVPTLTVITTADYPTPAQRPANSRLDHTRIRNTFGIHPSDWQAALNHLKHYEMANIHE